MDGRCAGPRWTLLAVALVLIAVVVTLRQDPRRECHPCRPGARGPVRRRRDIRAGGRTDHPHAARNPAGRGRKRGLRGDRAGPGCTRRDRGARRRAPGRLRRGPRVPQPRAAAASGSLPRIRRASPGARPEPRPRAARRRPDHRTRLLHGRSLPDVRAPELTPARSISITIPLDPSSASLTSAGDRADHEVEVSGSNVQ